VDFNVGFNRSTWMKVEIEDDQCAGCEFNGDGRISREQQGRRSEQRIPNLDGAPETISSKRNERDGTHTKPPVKSTNLIDILPLITVWLQVRVLPGPPTKSVGY